MNLASQYKSLLSIARRYARRPDEAEDIDQEVLLSAVAAGRLDLSLPRNRQWMAGAIRKRAAFDARGAARRRRRETQWQTQLGEQETDDHDGYVSILPVLPKSLRVVAALAFSGHTRREIACLLSIEDTAVRQRIAALKKAIRRYEGVFPTGLPGLDLEVPYGRIRQGLRPYLTQQRGIFASHDPDGHFFVLRSSQTT
ncbi:MAG: sigma-70 family RNA polymerase sigma factor [Rhizobiaceae bacterium]|nr:sigma-70 family RNA polymerase sigma factor [Rhizobiaceae bacterium]